MRLNSIRHCVRCTVHLSVLTQQEFNELGEKFEAFEHKLFGKRGFERIVKQVENIEKGLGIYRLDQFTSVVGSE